MATYPPNPTSTCALVRSIAAAAALTAPASRPGTVSSLGVTDLGIGTAGMSSSGYPRSGISRVSRPRSVPRQVTSAPGSIRRKASASASAGSM